MNTIRAFVEGRPAYSVRPDMNVLQAARYMCEKRVGAVVVLDGERPVGVFSERDLMERVVTRGRDSGAVRVDEVGPATS